MRSWLRFGLAVVVLLPVVALAQDKGADTAVAERSKKLAAIVEQALGDTQNLRLPENRAFFLAQSGNLFWPVDQGRALGLFQNAASELIGAQDLAESKRSSNPNNELLNGGSTRQQILNTVAARDARLALDLLVSTRPVAIQKAMLAETHPSSKISNDSGGYNYLVQNERSMEQNFYRMAADQDPEHAVQLLKESLAKNLSNETYYQLERLADKDTSAAGEMASLTINKLMAGGYMSGSQPMYMNIQLTNQILSNAMSDQAGTERKLKFDSGQVRQLASKFVSAYLSDPRTAPYIGSSIVPIAEKFSPSSVEAVRARTVSPQTGTPEMDAAYQKLMSADTPPEQMLAVAGKFSIDNRRNIYQTASSRLLDRGDTEAARNVLAENFEGDTRRELLANFDMQNSYNLINSGKFSEAERAIDPLPDQQRVPALIALANSVYAKDQKENRSYAESLLARAADVTGERPENSAEMGLLMQVISGYTNIRPDEAFRLFEGLVPKINELTDAAAVINGFQVGSNVRDGEFIMAQGDPFNGYGGNSSIIGTLAQSDFDRAMKLIDGFSRQEMRISMRLQTAASIGLTTNNGAMRSLPISGRSFGNAIMIDR
ncbi:MAG TPA: hypothetical protein VGJ02_01815 [Pyrinomonadaceae bacterium]